jgi:hypothetical protein
LSTNYQSVSEGPLFKDSTWNKIVPDLLGRLFFVSVSVLLISERIFENLSMGLGLGELGFMDLILAVPVGLLIYLGLDSKVSQEKQSRVLSMEAHQQI